MKVIQWRPHPKSEEKIWPTRVAEEEAGNSEKHEHTVRKIDFRSSSNRMIHEWADKWVRSIRFNEKCKHDHITFIRKETETHFPECTTSKSCAWSQETSGCSPHQQFPSLLHYNPTLIKFTLQYNRKKCNNINSRAYTKIFRARQELLQDQ